MYACVRACVRAAECVLTNMVLTKVVRSEQKSVCEI